MSQEPIEPEILPPGAPLPPRLAGSDQESGPSPQPESGERRLGPFHPVACTVLVVVDNLWAMEEWLVVTWILTIPLSFLTVFTPTLWIQRKVRGDSWGTAFLKALFFGVVAAVPTSVTGTPVGLALLAWAGYRGVVFDKGRENRWR